MMYQETGENWVYCVTTESRIPKWGDEEKTTLSAGWIAYESWMADGNIALPPDQAWLDANRPSVSALQGRLAIEAAGLVSAFISWKSGLDPVADFKTIAFFEAAETWEYDNPILDEGLMALGVMDQKLELFRLAATL